MEPIKDTLVGTTQCLTPAVISTGIKAAAATATAAIVRAAQSYNGISEGKIRQFLNNETLKFSKLYTTIKGTCTTPAYNMTNTNEETLIKYLMCKIITNEEKNEPFLQSMTLSYLASILNNYSDGEYIAMPKSLYDQEKQNALEAVSQTAAGTALTGAAIDAAFTAIKVVPSPSGKEFKTLMSPQSGTPGAPVTPEGQFVKSMVSAPIAVGTAYGLVYVGAELLKSYNTLIPKKYLPNFNILLTAIVERKKRIEEFQKDIDNCFINTKTQFVKNTMKPLIENLGRGKSVPYTLPITDRPIQLFKAEFDLENFDIRGNSSSKVYIENEIREMCSDSNRAIQLHINIAYQEIKNIEKVLNVYNSLFNIKTEMSIKDIAQQLVPIVNNLELAQITMERIRQIDTELQSLKEDIERKKTQTKTTEPIPFEKVSQTLSSVPGRTRDFFSSVGKTLTKKEGIFGKGGKNTKKTQKRKKIQKRRKRTHRRR